MGDVLTQRIAFAQQSDVKGKTIWVIEKVQNPWLMELGVVCAHCVEE